MYKHFLSYIYKIRQLAPTLPADGNVLSQKELNNTAGIIAEWISRGKQLRGIEVIYSHPLLPGLMK